MLNEAKSQTRYGGQSGHPKKINQPKIYHFDRRAASRPEAEKSIKKTIRPCRFQPNIEVVDPPLEGSAYGGINNQ
jgi:hypothetical protein